MNATTGDICVRDWKQCGDGEKGQGVDKREYRTGGVSIALESRGMGGATKSAAGALVFQNERARSSHAFIV